MMTAKHINYIEFAAADLDATRKFFEEAFDWEFQDYGPDYIAFYNAGVEGGFYRAEDSGGTITKAIFEFPGGRRFHFLEPSGNELAVWTNILDGGS